MKFLISWKKHGAQAIQSELHCAHSSILSQIWLFCQWLGCRIVCVCVYVCPMSYFQLLENTECIYAVHIFYSFADFLMILSTFHTYHLPSVNFDFIPSFSWKCPFYLNFWFSCDETSFFSTCSSENQNFRNDKKKQQKRLQWWMCYQYRFRVIWVTHLYRIDLSIYKFSLINGISCAFFWMIDIDIDIDWSFSLNVQNVIVEGWNNIG